MLVLVLKQNDESLPCHHVGKVHYRLYYIIYILIIYISSVLHAPVVPENRVVQALFCFASLLMAHDGSWLMDPIQKNPRNWFCWFARLSLKGLLETPGGKQHRKVKSGMQLEWYLYEHEVADFHLAQLLHMCLWVGEYNNELPATIGENKGIMTSSENYTV